MTYYARRPQGSRTRWLPGSAKITVWLLLCVITRAQAEDWPQWLGPHRDGIWRETGIVSAFPAQGPPVRWRVAVGPGYSGPAAAAGRVYLMDRQPELDAEGKPRAAEDTSLLGTERVLCFDTSNGKLLWQHEYDCPYKISYPTGPRTTPLIEDQRVYTLGAMGDVKCLNADTGQVIWSVSLLERFETKPPVWGYACHPMIDGDKLYLMAGGKDSAVVALDKWSGKTIWHALTVQEIGYAPVVLHQAADTRRLIIWHDVAVKALNPDNGEVLWSADFPLGIPQRPVVPIMTPLIVGNLLMVSNFYDGAMMLDVDWAQNTTQIKWVADKQDREHEQGINVLMATPFVDGDYLYGAAGNGELRCVELKTGRVVWRDVAPLGEENEYFATCFLVKNDDRFFLFNDQGYLIIARLTPAGYTELGRAKVLENSSPVRGRNIVWSHPAFANRAMFARNDKELICVDLAAPQATGQ
jgi:outer membrane protein assembly factor BamB